MNIGVYTLCSGPQLFLSTSQDYLYGVCRKVFNYSCKQAKSQMLSTSDALTLSVHNSTMWNNLTQGEVLPPWNTRIRVVSGPWHLTPDDLYHWMTFHTDYVYFCFDHQLKCRPIVIYSSGASYIRLFWPLLTRLNCVVCEMGCCLLLIHDLVVSAGFSIP